MTDPTSPLPPDQTPASPQPTGPHVAPQGPPPTGQALPPPGAPVPPGGTLGSVVTPATRRANAKAWIVGGVALVIALCCGGLGIAALSDGDGGEPTTSAASPTSASPTTAAPATTSPATATTAAAVPTTAAYDTPTKRDFKLAVKVLKKQCFGSAGCNITYRIDVTYTGNGLDPSKTYEVTYEVKGGEDPMINTFEVTGDTASVQQEEFGSTKRSSDKLTAVVTDVSEL